jgi:hypothetical protein
MSRRTRIPSRSVAEFAERLRADGVWTPDGRTACEWADEHGLLAFWMDVWVAQGLLERAPADGAEGPALALGETGRPHVGRVGGPGPRRGRRGRRPPETADGPP